MQCRRLFRNSRQLPFAIGPSCPSLTGEYNFLKVTAMQIILASASPRRKELLGYLGIDFNIVVPDIHERIHAGESPVDFCMRISREKALAVKSSNPGSLIIAADTIVVVDGEMLGKPENQKAACDYLRRLSGREHIVFTAYTVLPPDDSKEITKVVSSCVHFADMTDEDIIWYVSTGEPLDKAGAYGLQGIGAAFVDRIEGSHTNVIGLPLSELFRDLRPYIPQNNITQRRR
jgi:septum formation protein